MRQTAIPPHAGQQITSTYAGTQQVTYAGHTPHIKEAYKTKTLS
jgi:hypothetical protein